MAPLLIEVRKVDPHPVCLIDLNRVKERFGDVKSGFTTRAMMLKALSTGNPRLRELLQQETHPHDSVIVILDYHDVVTADVQIVSISEEGDKR